MSVQYLKRTLFARGHLPPLQGGKRKKGVSWYPPSTCTLYIHGSAGFWFQIQEAEERSRIAKTLGEPVNDETPLPVQVRSNQNQKLKLHQFLHHKSLACLCNSGLAEPEHFATKTPKIPFKGDSKQNNGNKTGIKYQAGFRGISTSATKLMPFLPHSIQAASSVSTQSKCIHKSLKATKLL